MGVDDDLLLHRHVLLPQRHRRRDHLCRLRARVPRRGRGRCPLALALAWLTVQAKVNKRAAGDAPPPRLALPLAAGVTIITPEVILTRSSRTRVKIFQFSKKFT